MRQEPHLEARRYPLNPTQQGMLFHFLSGWQPGVDVEQMICHLREPLRSDVLTAAWQRAVERHAALRTHFEWADREPLQCVGPSWPVRMDVHDGRGPSADEHTRRLEEFLIADRRRGFHLGELPLMRLTLFQWGEDDFCLVWTFHHAVLDGRSFTRVLTEVFEDYDALCRGEELPRSAPPNFADYARWLGTLDQAAAEQFWHRTLAGLTAPTPLPDSVAVEATRLTSSASHGLPTSAPAISGASRRAELQLSSEVTNALRTLAQRAGATLATVVQAAWAALLSRDAGDDDVVFGVTRACRHVPVADAENMVGVFINTLPMRVRVEPGTTVTEYLRQVRAAHLEVRPFEHTPLVAVQSWSSLPPRTPLFESLIVFENYELNETLRAQGGPWLRRSFELREQTNYPITLYGYAGQRLRLKLAYDDAHFDAATAERMLGHLRTLLDGMASSPDERVSRLNLLTPEERCQLLVEWNDTHCAIHDGAWLNDGFAGPEAGAPTVVCRDQRLTHSELDARANRLARHLRKLGVGPETLVGIAFERSVEMVVGLLGILKAGGAYVPLDPTYPKDRLAFVLADSKAPVLITQQRLLPSLPAHQAKVVCLDSDWPMIANESTEPFDSGVRPENLAYVIYTSGSTGKPKGVMAEHRNVANFFAGMDRALGNARGPRAESGGPPDSRSADFFAGCETSQRNKVFGEPPKTAGRRPALPGTWLAVTSLSFDISVLEIFWTLARGFNVVIYPGDDFRAATEPNTSALHHASKPIDFSLFYFSADQGEDPARKYRLLTEGAKFADEHGFTAVWTPERHFHEFGGLYPNPSVTSAYLAGITKRVQLRSGSVVAPLHPSIRIAEEWAVVDNLSNGRAAISFASGWMPEDFVIKPEAFAERKDAMFRAIETVRKLWRGERVAFPGPLGGEVQVRTLPRPIQRELPVWVTTAGNPETYEAAGKVGANILTHLLGQSVEEVAEKIRCYRQAWATAGHPGRGHVSLMLHTFVSDCPQFVKETVRRPLTEYLRTSASLIKKYSWAFPAFKKMGKTADEVNFGDLSPADLDAVLAHAFDRYFETSGLFGTPESCTERIDQLKANDIDEVACLIDFGVSTDVVLENLRHLAALQGSARGPRAESDGPPDSRSSDFFDDFRTSQRNEVFGGPPKTAGQRPALPDVEDDHSIPALIRHHGVTHFQCTPSMASLLLADDSAKDTLESLRYWLIGGEAFPTTLANQLRGFTNTSVINMYGPTETTIWSTTYPLNRSERSIPIGRPIANTEIYILDQHLQPVPVGVAGELMIGGAGVARGYLHRPELTAERFIPNPFSHDANARLYRTGDLARYRPDGNIEFIGRMDHQVKIRGYRIELGEIESVLNEHPTVRESVVIAREDVPGDKRLVAYVIARAGEPPNATELRNRVKARLPEYMVPAHVVTLDAFPQTPNKKIDRKALPAPTEVTTKREAVFIAPENDLEQTIAAIWKETLNVPQVGVNDNFFDLGGHSLLSVQVHNRLKKSLGHEFPLTDVFQFPTVRALAAHLGQSPTAANSSSAQRGLDRAQARRNAVLRRGAAASPR